MRISSTRARVQIVTSSLELASFCLDCVASFDSRVSFFGTIRRKLCNLRVLLNCLLEQWIKFNRICVSILYGWV